MKLALFDLDNTLLLGDSDHAWAEYLITLGVIDETRFRHKNDEFLAQYQAGTLDIDEFLAFQLDPLSRHSKAQLEAWRADFLTKIIDPMITDDARALIEPHRNDDTIIAIVTATNRFITAPITERFGIDNLIATELEEKDGRYTGRPVGVPSFRSGKITRLNAWLNGLGKPLDSFETSYFYSDSINDLPLLDRVARPTAVNPDAKLATVATERGWPIIRFGPIHGH